MSDIQKKWDARYRNRAGELPEPAPVLRDYLAATSVGLVGERLLVDLDYAEDFAAEVDMNVVMTRAGDLVEVQGTAEGRSFTRDELTRMLDMAGAGIRKLVTTQRQALGLRSLP